MSSTLTSQKKNYADEYRHSLHSKVLIFGSINISSMQFSPFLFFFLGVDNGDGWVWIIMAAVALNYWITQPA